MHLVARRDHQRPLEDWCMVGSSAPSAMTKNITCSDAVATPSSPDVQTVPEQTKRHHADIDGHTDRRLEQYRVTLK